MKKLLLTFLIAGMGLVSQAQQSQNVSIPDTNFLNYLIDQKIDINGDRIIQQSEATLVTRISFYYFSYPVKSMVGIEAFVNLSYLFFSGTDASSTIGTLASIDLSKNILLDTLVLTGHQITSLDLNKNTKLLRLDASQNLLKSVDFSQSANLRLVDLSRNQLSALDVSQNKKMTYVSAHDNLMSNLNVSQLDSLRQLYAFNNPNLFTICISPLQSTRFSQQKLYINKDSTTSLSAYCVDKTYGEVIKVYNFVSPNGDGKHDFLEIENIESYGNNSLQIFNRWGQKMFSADGVKNSDKILSDIDWPDGTYYYVLDLGNDSKPDRGYFLLKK